MDGDNNGDDDGVLANQLIPHLRGLNEPQLRLLFTVARAAVNPDLDQKQRSAIPGMLDRLLRHAKALGCADYDQDGLPVDDAGNPMFPPSEEDCLVLVSMVLAAHPEDYAKYPDGRWGPVIKA
jgi:hypothetical protein